MANIFFQFKKFKVEQSKSALKVCTDACLFGALISAEIQNLKFKIQNILDIGSGTGLLMLMLAQKCSAKISGVEIDEPSYKESKENIEDSPWKERLNVQHIPVQQFNDSTGQPFDLIISNPPFFENDLRSLSTKKNISKHDESLKLDELLNSIDKLLSKQGLFAVLLPYHRTEYFISLCAERSFYIQEKVFVRQTPKHDPFRTIIIASRGVENNSSERTITIKDENDKYTPEFTELLKDYYLYL